VRAIVIGRAGPRYWPAACQDYDLFVRLRHPSQRILAVIAPSGDGEHRTVAAIEAARDPSPQR